MMHGGVNKERIDIKLAVSTKWLVLLFRKEKYLMMIDRNAVPVWGFDN